MKVVIKQSEIRKASRELSYQAPFKTDVNCRKCKELMHLFLLVNDDIGELIKERPDSLTKPEGVKIWPHDCSTTAVYLCTNCGAMRATWNQA
jgi:hypothetical protein